MNPNIVALLEDIKNGKSLSFDAIYQLYIPLIESTAKYYCKRFSLSDSEMDDIRQEAAIAWYNAAIAYEPEKNIPFGAFAKVCLRNRILSYIRYFHENQTSESLDDVDAEPDIPVSETPEQLMINKESLTELHHRIDEMLTDFEKSVFALYVGSMSYMDIAKALSKPKKSIDNAIHRIKAKLRKLL